MGKKPAFDAIYFHTWDLFFLFGRLTFRVNSSLHYRARTLYTRTRNILHIVTCQRDGVSVNPPHAAPLCGWFYWRLHPFGTCQYTQGTVLLFTLEKNR